MKLKLLFFLLSCFLSFFAHAQKGVRKSLRLAAPPVIDGNVDEWQTDWLMDSKTKFLYNVANDSNNLYIRLKISDDMAQQKIAVFGLTIYFNPEGTSRGKLGLGYPIEKNKEEMKKEQAGDGGKVKTWAEIKRDLIRDADLLELIGLAKKKILSPRVGLMNGIEVILIIDSFGDLVYETKIPFKAYHIDKSKVETLGLFIETGRLNVKPSGSSGTASYYRGVRYAAPRTSQPYSEFSVATILRLNFKLN